MTEKKVLPPETVANLEQIVVAFSRMEKPEREWLLARLAADNRYLPWCGDHPEEFDAEDRR